MVLSLVEGEAPPNARCQRIGPALLFELWHEVGCRAVLEELAAGRQFEFAAERAVFFLNERSAASASSPIAA